MVTLLICHFYSTKPQRIRIRIVLGWEGRTPLFFYPSCFCYSIRGLMIAPLSWFSLSVSGTKSLFHV